jgi:carotenoid cleavage dioxygenase
MVWDAVAKHSELLVIDAQNFTAEPVARVLMPQRVPFGFHAAWISEAQMATQQS